MFFYKYTDKELKELLNSLVFIVDTREQDMHVLDYFEAKKLNVKREKLDTADYAVMIPKNVDYGILRDTYIKCLVERKNSIDELASSIKAERFEHELIRAQGNKLVLVVEDTFENLILGKYRSEYNSNALVARLKSFEARYGFTTVFINKVSTAEYVYKHLYYHARTYLKGYLKQFN